LNDIAWGQILIIDYFSASQEYTGQIRLIFDRISILKGAPSLVIKQRLPFIFNKRDVQEAIKKDMEIFRNGVCHLRFVILLYWFADWSIYLNICARSGFQLYGNNFHNYYFISALFVNCWKIL